MSSHAAVTADGSEVGRTQAMPASLRETIVGVVFNQFRGDPALLDDGIVQLEQRCGVPVLGTLPHLGNRPMLGVEGSLDFHAGDHRPSESPPWFSGRLDRHPHRHAAALDLTAGALPAGGAAGW